MKVKGEIYMAPSVDEESHSRRVGGDNGLNYLPLNSSNNSNNGGQFYNNSKSTSPTGLLANSIHIMGLLTFVSLAFSFYLAFGDVESGTCDISSTVSCSSVIKSSYGELFGVPVAVLGITWNTILLLAIWRVMVDDKTPHYLSFIYIWCSVGIGFVIYFITAEYIIGAICPFCTVVHVINVALMYFSFKLYNELRNPPHLGLMISSLQTFFIFTAVLHIAVVGLYWGMTPERPNEWSMNQFARCLTDQHIEFFGSESCHACQRQKSLFLTHDKQDDESPWKHITFVECFKNEQCQEQHHRIVKYPTWIRFNDEGKEIDRHEGYMNAHELSKMSGCIYKKDQQGSSNNEKSKNLK